MQLNFYLFLKKKRKDKKRKQKKRKERGKFNNEILILINNIYKTN